MKTIIFLTMIFTFQDAGAFVPNEAYTFDFNVKTVRMGRVKEEKIERAVEILRQVFSSPEFKDRILSHQYLGRKRFAYNKGLSNQGIYKKILKGVERLYPYQNNAMDVELELFTDYSSNVLGFTRPRSKRIWMNTKYFDRHTPAEIASNLTHEWLHKLGFDHEREKSKYRKYSVPYAIGYIVKDLARGLDEESRYSEGSYQRKRSLRHRTNHEGRNY